MNTTHKTRTSSEKKYHSHYGIRNANPIDLMIWRVIADEWRIY